MAMRLVFCAMTQQRDCAALGQLLQKAQRELLPMVFDRFVLPIDSAAFE